MRNNQPPKIISRRHGDSKIRKTVFTIIPRSRENHASESATAKGNRIVYSAVRNNADSEPKRVKTSWTKFVDIFKKPILRGMMPLKDYLACKKDDDRNQLANVQKNGQGIIPGEFSRKGTKSKDDLKSRTLLVLDLDDGHYSFEQLAKKLRRFSCIIHTSYSHSQKEGKFRVYIRFDKPVTKDIEITCARMLDYFETLLGEHIDTKCWTVSQLYYTPSCPPDAGELYRWEHIKGKPIQTSDFRLSKVADSETVKEATQSTGNRPGDDYNSRGEWKEHLQKLGWHHYSTDTKGNECWTRPGKSGGISGVVFKDTNVFYVFSSAPRVSPFEGGKAYSLFRAYTLIEHGGNPSVAASKLRTEGYGGTEGEKKGPVDVEAPKRAISSFPVVPFPLEVLPRYFRELVVAYSKALQCAPAFMAMNFMTIISSAAGNAVSLKFKRKWKTAPFIWFYVIGLSGEGKSHPIDIAMEPLNNLQALEDIRYNNELKQYKQELAEYQKSKNKDEPPKEPTKMRHYFTNEFTIEALIPIFQTSSRGIVIHADELSGLFKSMDMYRGGRGADTERLLNLFNCKQIKSDRKGVANYCRESGAAVIGGIQPERLKEIFTDKLHDNGMVYRFLPMLLNDLAQKDNDDDISRKDEREWTDLVRWMYTIPAPVDPETGSLIKNYFTLKGEARELFNEFRGELSGLRPFMPKQFRGYTAKLEVYCMKFMVLLHLIECYPKRKLVTSVNIATVRGAIEHTRFFAGQAARLIAGASKEKNPYDGAIREALISLKDEFKNGKLVVERVRLKVNEKVPADYALDKDSNKQFIAWLRAMGFTVGQGAGNKSVVLWNADIISS